MIFYTLQIIDIYSTSIKYLILCIQINGIRLIDKTIVGKKTLFRMEIWLRNGADQEKLDDLKRSLTSIFGSEITVTRNKVDKNQIIAFQKIMNKNKNN